MNKQNGVPCVMYIPQFPPCTTSIQTPRIFICYCIAYYTFSLSLSLSPTRRQSVFALLINRFFILKSSRSLKVILPHIPPLSSYNLIFSSCPIRAYLRISIAASRAPNLLRKLLYRLKVSPARTLVRSFVLCMLSVGAQPILSIAKRGIQRRGEIIFMGDRSVICLPTNTDTRNHTKYGIKS